MVSTNLPLTPPTFQKEPEAVLLLVILLAGKGKEAFPDYNRNFLDSTLGNVLSWNLDVLQLDRESGSRQCEVWRDPGVVLGA